MKRVVLNPATGRWHVDRLPTPQTGSWVGASAPHTRTLPSGTVTFYFTDVEGSTKLWEAYPSEMGRAIELYDTIIRREVERNGGVVFKMLGDACCAAFARANDALSASLATQTSIAAQPWGRVGEIRVRAALHTGAPEQRGGDYFGQPLNRVARLLSAGHGGQILLSSVSQELVRDQLPEGVGLRDLGAHRLKDLLDEEHIFQATGSGLPQEFPVLRTVDSLLTNLPVQRTRLLGRAVELREVRKLLRQKGPGLVTLTGTAGIGKTRLAVEAASVLIGEMEDGVFIVPLATTTDSDLMLSEIASALGIRESGGESLAETVEGYLHEKHMLLILDNLEHIRGGAEIVGRLMAAPAG